MTKPVPIPPDATRVIEGLRDTGYVFNTAVADVVDNSVAAEASRVDIQLKRDFRGVITLRIYDDGIGMSETELHSAMQYGSPVRRSKASLGKFGLGLKTASTAFCRRLTVISRNSASAALQVAIWDLDHVKSCNKWEALAGPAGTEETAMFDEVLSGKRGTLVVWEKADRVMKNYVNANGAPAVKAFDRIVENLRFHLGMVFQRFLDAGDSRAGRHVDMTLNGTAVTPWDPFCTDVSRMEGEETIPVEMPGGSTAEFRIRAFVLPRKEGFPSEDRWRNARLTNYNQGIYVYRENRLIHGPDWLGLFAKEPHLTLLRIEFSFDHRLDEAFQVDIKKSQVILDESIAAWVNDFLNPRRRSAEDLYRRGRKKDVADQAKNAHDDSNRRIASREKDVKGPLVKSLDAGSGMATLVNNSGEVRLKLKIVAAQRKDEVHVRAVESIDDGLLWEPAFIDGHCAVLINQGHPYYAKVYVPNVKALEGVTVQGLDSLLWALSLAELNCVGTETRDMFLDMRYEVSRNLKKLVDDLPDPKLVDE
jgi:hypothetical protein